MDARRTVGLAGLLVVALCACGGPSRHATTPVSDGDTLATLRYRLAVNPKDRAARIGLGLLYARTHMRRAALRELDKAHKVSALRGQARRTLAELLLVRAKARIAAHALGGAADLHRAVTLAPALKPPAQLRASAMATSALALLNSSDADRRKRGREQVERLLALAPHHPLAAVAAPDDANAAALGAAVRWLHARGARRLVLQLGNAYVKRGGRDAAVIRPWLRAFNWWHGANTRPDLLLMNELARAQIRVCDIARLPNDYGCNHELKRIAASAERSRRLLARARQLFWYDADPRDAGPWAIISLRAWLFGGADGWLAELSRRVDVHAVVAAPAQIPLYARATLLRAAGNSEAAARALTAALARADSLSGAQRAVVLVEAALQHRRAWVTRALTRLKFDGALGWRAALVVARVYRREVAVLERAPKQYARSYLLASGRLGPAAGLDDDAAAQLRFTRWWQALASAPSVRRQTVARWRTLGSLATAPSAPVTALGSVDLLATEATARLVRAGQGSALARIATTYAKDRAVADRLAQQFADGGLRVGPRAAALAALFAQLGDPQRVRRWGNAVVAANPQSWRHLVTGAVANAIGGQPRLARVRFLAAASRAPDPGAVKLLAAQTFVRLGAPVDALVEARTAIRHTAPGEAQAVYQVIIAASLKLHRIDDAARTARRWIADTPAPFRAAARDYVVTTWPVLAARLPGARRRPQAPGRRGDESDVAAALAAGTTARLDAARLWNPYDTRATAALIAKLTAPTPRRRALTGQLLASVLVRWEQGGRVAPKVMAALTTALASYPTVAAALREQAARYARTEAIRQGSPDGFARKTPGR